MKTLTILNRPLKFDEMVEQKDEHNFVTAVVRVDFDNVAKFNYEAFLDELSSAMTNTDLLMDISYKVVGHEDDNIVLVEVSGDVSEILKCEGYEDAEDEA